MGIDFLIDLACEPKEQLGSAGIVSKLKARDRAEYVLQMFREQGDQRPLSELTFVTAVMRPDGEREERDVSVQELFDQARGLEPLARHCEGCPANISGVPYGCNGYVNYPVEEDSERWLLSLLPEDLGSTAGHLLMRASADLGWTGERAAHLRAAGDMFFESRDAMRVRWGDGDDAFHIDSDQLFDALFSLGNLQPAHMGMMALFLGVVPHDLDPGQLSALSDGDKLASLLRFDNLESEGAAEQIDQLTTFVRAMARAAVLGTELLVDS